LPPFYTCCSVYESAWRTENTGSNRAPVRFLRPCGVIRRCGSSTILTRF